jgi:hypothetical protein
MTHMKFVAALASASLLSFAAQAAVNTPQTLPVDKPTTVNNIGLDCMGVGTRDRDRSLVKDYSVRLETVGGYGQYLASDDITLRNRHGQKLLNVTCDAPWLMIKLDPGRYDASVAVPGATPRDVWFAASDRGMHEVYVRFPGKMAGREDRMMKPTHDGKTNEATKQS